MLNTLEDWGPSRSRLLVRTRYKVLKGRITRLFSCIIVVEITTIFPHHL